jgi:hypothetical protein
MVTRAGFKPTTACLEGRSSIQLSYRVGNRHPARGRTAEIAAKITKFFHSARRLSTGLASAARSARRLMVNRVMTSVSPAASAKTHQPIVIR